MKSWVLGCAAALMVLGASACSKSAAPAGGGGSAKTPDEKSAAPSAETPKASGDAAAALDRAIRYLRSQQDDQTGAVRLVADDPKTRNVAVTAMAVTGILGNPKGLSEADKAAVNAAVQWIVGLQKPDGSIYEDQLANYCTSTAVMMLATIGDPKHKPVIEKALGYIQRTQRNEDHGFKPGDSFFGGVGYEDDDEKKADLSNSSFGIEAAHEGGLPKDAKFFKDAQTFLSRTQNHGETNDQVWKDEKGQEVRPGNDGGAIYAPGKSKAGVEVLPDGRRVFRSYGSMSYALLKSYIFCGLDRRDPRVKAVAQWCAENFNVDLNPGFVVGEKGTEPYQGLFYYYMSMAKALRLIGDDKVTDKSGVARDWRAELTAKLLSLQKPDGSFVNPKNTRWDEASPVLCTAYAAITLREILGQKK